MGRVYFSFFILLILMICSKESLGSECLVSKPNIELPEPFTYITSGFGWYGDAKLAARIPIDGVWRGMGVDHHFRDKFLWWEKSNSLSPNDNTKIEISAINLNDGSKLPTGIYAGNIYVGENFRAWGGMLTAIEFPSIGCWKITGRFRGHKIQFSVLVKDK